MAKRSRIIRARGALLAGLILLLLPGEHWAQARVRSVLVLPFATADLGREEQWLGEGVAQSLLLALVHVPGLVEVDRERLKQVARPEAWDETAAAQAGRRLGADVVLYGEVRRTGGEITVHPRYLELRGERVERGALEAVGVAEGQLMDRLRVVPLAYLRALRVTVGETDAARVTKWASPTPSAAAFEHYVRGRSQWYRGGQEAYEAAIALLTKAAELDPQFVAAQYALGQVHQSLGNRWKAAAQFRASTQLDPNFAEPYKALGDLFLTAPRRLFDQAVETYNKALEIRPHYADAYAGLGDAKAAKGDVDGAVTAYQRALALNPVNARVHVSLGRIYYAEKGLYYESVGAYKKAIELDPAYLEARMGLAEVYEDKGLYQEAIEEYRKVAETDPKNMTALYNLAAVYEKVDPREAVVLWERYIEKATGVPSEKDALDIARLHLRKLRNQLEREK